MAKSHSMTVESEKMLKSLSSTIKIFAHEHCWPRITSWISSLVSCFFSFFRTEDFLMVFPLPLPALIPLPS